MNRRKALRRYGLTAVALLAALLAVLLPLRFWHSHAASASRPAPAEALPDNVIATAPGKVVFRNSVIELLQYAPTTAKVHARPLLIFPPWINKFYILDLRPENSFIRWLVGRGYTVFVVSWVNPDGKMAEMGFEDYMQGGIFAALDDIAQS